MANNDIVPGFDDENIDGLKIKLARIEDLAGGLTMTLQGYLDTYNSSSFNRCVLNAIQAGFHRLIFQCGGLNYVSSTGIGTFTTIMKALKARGGDLVFQGMQPKVMEVFQLLGFSKFFNMRDTSVDSTNFFKSIQPAEKESVFPKVITCPICVKKLNVVRAGRFRCSSCKSVIAINEVAQVFLG
jgi:anti-anti-sigma factor